MSKGWNRLDHVREFKEAERKVFRQHLTMEYGQE